MKGWSTRGKRSGGKEGARVTSRARVAVLGEVSHSYVCRCVRVCRKGGKIRI